MTKLTTYIIVLLFMTLMVVSCRTLYMRLPSESYTSPMKATIKYQDFPQAITNILLMPQINLTITKVSKDTIDAIEVYQGSSHTSWFIFSTRWMEKTEYKIIYKEIKESQVSGNVVKNVTSFSISTKSSEAPNKNYDKWQVTSPSKFTKTYNILTELSKYGR